MLLPPAANACPRISAGGSSERSSFAATFLPGTLWWLPPRVCAQRRSGCFGALPPGTRLVYRAPSRGAGRGRPRETIPRPPRAPPLCPCSPVWGGGGEASSRYRLAVLYRMAPAVPPSTLQNRVGGSRAFVACCVSWTMSGVAPVLVHGMRLVVCLSYCCFFLSSGSPCSFLSTPRVLSSSPCMSPRRFVCRCCLWVSAVPVFLSTSTACCTMLKVHYVNIKC